MDLCQQDNGSSDQDAAFNNSITSLMARKTTGINTIQMLVNKVGFWNIRDVQYWRPYSFRKPGVDRIPDKAVWCQSAYTSARFLWIHMWCLLLFLEFLMIFPKFSCWRLDEVVKLWRARWFPLTKQTYTEFGGTYLARLFDIDTDFISARFLWSHFLCNAQYMYIFILITIISNGASNAHAPRPPSNQRYIL